MCVIVLEYNLLMRCQYRWFHLKSCILYIPQGWRSCALNSTMCIYIVEVYYIYSTTLCLFDCLSKKKHLVQAQPRDTHVGELPVFPIPQRIIVFVFCVAFLRSVSFSSVFVTKNCLQLLDEPLCQLRTKWKKVRDVNNISFYSLCVFMLLFTTLNKVLSTGIYVYRWSYNVFQ